MDIRIVYDGDGNVMVTLNGETKSFFVEYPDETDVILDYLDEFFKKDIPKYKGN